MPLPKKPATAFALFLQHKSNEIKTPPGEPRPPMKEISRLWKETTEKERQKYQKEAAEAKIKYLYDVAKHLEDHPEDMTIIVKEKNGKGKRKNASGVDEPKSPKKTKLKDPLKPKGARKSFSYYVSDYRESLTPGTEPTLYADLLRQAGEAWKNLPKEAKAPYEKKAADDKERAARELGQYQGETGEKSVSELKKEEKEKKKLDKERKREEKKLKEEEKKEKQKRKDHEEREKKNRKEEKKNKKEKKSSPQKKESSPQKKEKKSAKNSSSDSEEGSGSAEF